MVALFLGIFCLIPSLQMSSIHDRAKKFLDDYPEDKALAILERERWASRNDLKCPLCKGWRLYKEERKGKPGFYRCPISHPKGARSSTSGQYVFSVRTGSILEHSHVPLSKWLYCLATVPPTVNNQ